MSGPNVDLHSIHHHIVKSAIEAMNGRNKKQWYDLFSDNPDLTDDDTHHDFTEWSERELFGSSVAYLASIDKVEDGELMIYGSLGSMGRF